MRIEPIKNVVLGQRSERRNPDNLDRFGQEAQPISQKSLVVQSSLERQKAQKPSYRRSTVSAPLVAHLIATHEQLPQTRTHRRVSVQEGHRAYASVRSMVKTPLYDTSKLAVSA